MIHLHEFSLTHKLIEQANLKQSSLHDLAKTLNITDHVQFVEKFIQHDREVRQQ